MVSTTDGSPGLAVIARRYCSVSMHAQIPASKSHPNDCPDGSRHPHLARPLEIERIWGDAPATPTDTLDRFESAIAFAIREASRLQCDSASRAIAVSRIEVPER